MCGFSKTGRTVPKAVDQVGFSIPGSCLYVKHVHIYMLQSIVGTRHYRECLKFSGNAGSACDHQSLPVLPKIFRHYRE